MNAEELTNERARTHGKFSDHAKCTMDLKQALTSNIGARLQRGQAPLTDQHLEALHMILHKIGRIVAGQSTLQDHWDDIAGYAYIANKDHTNEEPTGTKK